MRYIVPKFNCMLLNGQKLYKDVQYICEFVDNTNFVLFGFNKEIPLAVTFCDKCGTNVEKVNYKNNEYYFIFPQMYNRCENVQLKYQNKSITISLNSSLTINIEGEKILEQQVEDLAYSHYEITNQHCVIYFVGKRNFVVIIKDSELKCASYYDEINLKDNEYFFMCKQFDSLNHGKVFHLKDNQFDDYLVYLDDFDMNLKIEFVACVFLDCLIAGNLNYANNLLCEELQQKDSSKLLKFFPNFDWFYMIEENVCALFKKNTLAGIYNFEIKDNLITNIIQLE